MALRSNLKRKFYLSGPGKKFISSSKRFYLPGFSGFSLHETGKSFRQQLRKTSLVERASSISFNIVMAIPPILIFIFTIVPYLPISKQFIHQLFVLIRDIIPGQKTILQSSIF